MIFIVYTMSCEIVTVNGCKIAKCLVNGNMCDQCFDESIVAERKKTNVMIDGLEKESGFLSDLKSAVTVEEFDEIKDVQGVNSVYELTLTTTKDDPYELRMYFDKICKSKMFDVKAFKACVELQQNGNPHIHAMLWSGKKVLNSNHIKAKIKFPYRFSLAFVRRQQNFYDYILKEKDSPIIIEYCRKKGIPHQWHTENTQHPNDEKLDSESVSEISESLTEMAV